MNRVVNLAYKIGIILGAAEWWTHPTCPIEADGWLNTIYLTYDRAADAQLAIDTLQRNGLEASLDHLVGTLFIVSVSSKE